MHYSHTAIEVADLDASLAFYEDGLGLDHQWDFTLDGVRNYYVGTGDTAQLQLKHDPERDGEVDTAGLDHLAFGVDDADAAFDRLVAATDCPVVTAPADVAAAGRRVAFVADPDGYEVELVAPMR
ncbi:MAG: VOC family protein [Halobacteriales archaeon]|nr:VOC family protein [Halobacteriales archaeon]